MAYGAPTVLDALRARNAAIANLGRHAVSGVSLTSLFDEACSTLAHVLDVDLTSVVEEQAHAFVLRAGDGFPADVIDRSIAPLGTSLAGFTLDQGEPVVLVDVNSETRFEVSERLRTSGVISGVAVPIRGRHRPFGVVSVLSCTQRQFTEADVVIVRLVANTLAGAVESERARSTIRARDHVLMELVEHGPDILIRFDRTLRHLYVSPAIERATGLAPQHFIGHTNEELGMPVELCELWRRELEPVLRTGEPRRFDFSYDGPEGTRFFESHAVSERGPDGSRQSVVVFTRDRTEARQAELALLGSEARYRELFERALDMIFLFDTEGRIVDINPAAEQTLGYPPSELVGQRYELIVPPEEVGEIAQRLALKLDGSAPTSAYESVVVCKDGRQVPVHVRSQVLLRDDEPTGVLTISRDISDQVAARDRALSSERRFRGAFDDAATGMVLVDPEGMILRANAAFARMLQYFPVELTGTKIFEYMPPEDTEAGLAKIMAIARGEMDSFRIDKSYVRRDGSSLAVHVVVSGVRDGDGALQYFVVHVQDLSALRRVQSELDETEERLRQSQKLEAIGQLAGGVAHDFNNLLTAINGYSDLALAELNGEPTSTHRFVQEIRRAGERAAELTRQLLTFSRRQVLEPEVIDINDVVNSYLSMLGRLVGEDIAIAANLADSLPMVHADPGQLGQVLLNLVVNARDAMPDGGRLSIETRASHVADGLRVVLSVSDSGHGMEPETVEHIFEPFFTTKEQGKGTGLGLSTVYGIVEQSGGKVEVESAPGEGSTFTVYLPPTAKMPNAPAKPESKPAAGAGECVLVVEDDSAVRGLVEEMLTVAGYAVIVAATPSEAIAFAEGRAIDAVITDVVMPEMNGQRLAEHLHQLRPGVPVLFTSGYAGDIIEARGLVEASDAFVRKPYSASTLIEKLQALLDARVAV
ncbi:MAG TPA: PAS domain S-box protein [Gaiellaceae bacterium]|nr:PAS domain S-box protein [Gaiellaceae bacterium]